MNGGHACRSRFVAVAGLVAAAALAESAGGASEAPLLESRLVVWGFTQGESLRQPRGIAFDPRDGAIYVANTGQHRIEVFSGTGRPLARFVHRVTQPDNLLTDGAPCALAFDRAGHLLVADQAVTYVDVLNRRGRSLTHLDIPTGQPTALAVGVDGTIYVGTTAEPSRIYRFRPDYAPAETFGEAGEGPGQLHNVTAIAELPDSTIAVACARTELGIQIFTRAGEYLRGFGTHELGRGNLSLPSGVAGSAGGRIWVCDEIRHSLMVFEQNGGIVAEFGGRGSAAGEFAHPSSLASDGKGLIAITDRELGRFQILFIGNRELPAPPTASPQAMESSAADTTATIAPPQSMIARPAATTRPQRRDSVVADESVALAAQEFNIAVGMYPDRALATSELARIVGACGLSGRVARVRPGSAVMYGIFIGSFPDRGTADRKARELVSSGAVNEARVLPRGPFVKR